MKPILLLVLFVILHSSGIFNKNLTAQIIIDENDQAPELVEKIVGPNVYVENETLTAHWWQPGFFLNGNSTNLGLDEGVVLTTGCADLVPGPNYYWNGSANCYTASGSYEPLTSLIPYSTHDAAVLEFDIIPESDTIHFRYVFGSEEYSDKLHTPTAYDVFGCFITGPSPDGGNYENENIAYVPGTNGLPI